MESRCKAPEGRQKPYALAFCRPSGALCKCHDYWTRGLRPWLLTAAPPGLLVIPVVLQEVASPGYGLSLLRGSAAHSRDTGPFQPAGRTPDARPDSNAAARASSASAGGSCRIVR